MNLSVRALPLFAAASFAISPSPTLPPSDPPRGSLVIVGGGERSRSMRRFVELAGGRGSRIAVVPSASSEPEETGRALAAELDSLGAQAFIYHLDRAAATLPYAEALAREREVFQRLRASDEAAALRAKFFAR